MLPMRDKQTTKQTITEDRVTQPMEVGDWVLLFQRGTGSDRNLQRKEYFQKVKQAGNGHVDPFFIIQLVFKLWRTSRDSILGPERTMNYYNYLGFQIRQEGYNGRWKQGRLAPIWKNFQKKKNSTIMFGFNFFSSHIGQRGQQRQWNKSNKFSTK